MPRCVKNGGHQSKNVVLTINGFGCVYGPEGQPFLVYRIHSGIICLHRIRRVVGRMKTHHCHISRLPGSESARELAGMHWAGLLVTALDGLFWFGSQRIAADVLELKAGMRRVVTTTVEVRDNLTGTALRKYRRTISDTTIRGILLWQAASTTFFILYPVPENVVTKETGMRNPVTILSNLSLEHELNEWL